MYSRPRPTYTCKAMQYQDCLEVQKGLQGLYKGSIRASRRLYKGSTWSVMGSYK